MQQQAKLVAPADDHLHEHHTIAEVREELKTMTLMGFPIAVMGLLGYLKNMIQVACMGRLGSLELAGGALAIGFTNITGYSVLSGLAMGMEPLCSQGFGSRNASMASLTLQRTTLMLLTASLPIGLLWANLEPVMLRLHQDPDISRVASLYCRVAIPDLIANSLLHPLRIYLRSKGTTWPIMWSTLLAISLHLPITIILAFSFSFGVIGIAISTFITNFNIVFFLIAYMLYSRIREHQTTYFESPLLSPPSSKNVSLSEEWEKLIWFAIPSCLSVCLEWWWYEFMTFLAGYLPETRVALSTSAIVIQTTSLLYTLPMTLSATVSTRVGNELGAGRPKKARLVTSVAIGLAMVSSFLGIFLTTLGSEGWARVFTEDEEVVKLSKLVLPIIGICELGNCPQTTSCGVLRGSARPGVGAGINFYSFYLVGAPVALALAFVWKLGLVGLCYGLLAAQIACAVSILMVVYKTDWEREALKAKELVGKRRNHTLAHDLDDGGERRKCEGFGLFKEVDILGCDSITL